MCSNLYKLKMECKMESFSEVMMPVKIVGKLPNKSDELLKHRVQRQIHPHNLQLEPFHIYWNINISCFAHFSGHNGQRSHSNYTFKWPKTLQFCLLLLFWRKLWSSEEEKRMRCDEKSARKKCQTSQMRAVHNSNGSL